MKKLFEESQELNEGNRDQQDTRDWFKYEFLKDGVRMAIHGDGTYEIISDSYNRSIIKIIG